MPSRTTPHFSARKRLIVAAVSGCFFTAPAWSNPTAPQVVNGAATFNQAGKLLTVTNTNGAIINWNTFSISAGETTRFNQPTAASSVLNRVLANDPSVLLGTLSSNGKVWLVNPAGIMVGQGARIDVAGFIGSTLNLRNEDFLANRLNFQATPNAGSIQNYGQITTPSGGSVYLVAPAVENHGIINASNGEVILAAGQTVQLVDTGTPGVKVEITGAEGSATNLGEIVSEAGRIGLAGVLVKNSGTLNASSLVKEGGRVFLKASQDAYVDGAGRIVTTGTKGGSIEVLGNRVAVMDQAQLDASGSSGGGTVLVGGDYQGKNPAIQNANITYFGPQASIKADAITNGDGGKVIVWADDTTRAYGNISAQGGPNGGNGGFVETSGHRYLDVAGIKVNTSAPNGSVGNWLLDPNDINIYHYGGPGVPPDSQISGNPFTPTQTDASASSLSDYTINQGLLSGNVTVTTSSANAGNGDITINGTVDAAGAVAITNSSGFARTFTLKADRDIALHDGASISSTSLLSLTMLAKRDISLGQSFNDAYGGAVALMAGWDGVSPSTAPILAASAPTGGYGGSISLTGANIPNAGTIDVSAYGGLNISGMSSVNGGAGFYSTGNMNVSAHDITLTATYGGSVNMSLFGVGIQNIAATNTLTLQGTTSSSNVFSDRSATIDTGSSAATQNITAGQITLNAGTYNSSSAGYGSSVSLSAAGAQNIYANTISLYGGATGHDNFARINASGNQNIAVGSVSTPGALTLTGGGDNSPSVYGGAGSFNNATHIQQFSNGAYGQTITIYGGPAGGGSLVLAGGAGTGVLGNTPGDCVTPCAGLSSSNLAAIGQSGSGTQTINFYGGGATPNALTITGGSGGNHNFAGIESNGTGSQWIGSTTGNAPNITLTGGISGGTLVTDGTSLLGFRGISNEAGIWGNTLQTIYGGSIALNGGGNATSYGGAQIGADATSNIFAGGDLTLTGGASNAPTGTYNLAAAALLGNGGNLAINLDVGGNLAVSGGSGASALAMIGSIQGSANVAANVGGSITVSTGNSGAGIGSKSGGGGSVSLKAGQDIVFGNDTGFIGGTASAATNVTLLAQRDISLGQLNGGGATDLYGGSLVMTAGWGGGNAPASQLTTSSPGGNGGAITLTGTNLQTKGAGNIDVNAYGGLTISGITADYGGAGFFTAGNGYMSIAAQDITLNGGYGGQAFIATDGTGTQTVTAINALTLNGAASHTTSTGVNSGYAIIRTSNTSTVLGTQHISAHQINMNAGGSGSLGSKDGNFVRIQGTGTQIIDITGANGGITIYGGGAGTSGGSNNYGEIEQISSNGSQTITFDGSSATLGIYGGSGNGLNGGTGDCGSNCSGYSSNNNAGIHNLGSGGQTVDVGSGSIALYGGTVGNHNNAYIYNKSAGLQQISSGSLWLQGGNSGGIDSRTLPSPSETVFGSSYLANNASITSGFYGLSGMQSIDTGSGSITVKGNNGSGSGLTGAGFASVGMQDVYAGTIDLTGAGGTAVGAARILSLAQQTIGQSGSRPAITLTGGDSSGGNPSLGFEFADSFMNKLANNAVIASGNTLTSIPGTQTIYASQITLKGTSRSGSATGFGGAGLFSAGSQTVDVTGAVSLLGGDSTWSGGGAASRTRLWSMGSTQTINADSLSVIGATSGASGANIATVGSWGEQFITLRHANGPALTQTTNAAAATNVLNNGAYGGQTLTFTGVNAELRLTGPASGLGTNNAAPGNQSIQFMYGGSIVLTGVGTGSPTQGTNIQSFGNQSITGVTSISITGAATAYGGAGIYADGNQYIETGSLTLHGGIGTGYASPAEIVHGGDPTSTGNQTIVMTGAGASATLYGGSGSGTTTNNANLVPSVCAADATCYGQSVTGDWAGIHSGTGNQSLTFQAAGGTLSIIGGSGGNRNSAWISNGGTGTQQTIAGFPDITLTGGASGGNNYLSTDGFHYLRNNASIFSPSGAQTIEANSLTLNGISAGAAAATISSAAVTGNGQNITVSNAIALNSGTSTAAATAIQSAGGQSITAGSIALNAGNGIGILSGYHGDSAEILAAGAQNITLTGSGNVLSLVGGGDVGGYNNFARIRQTSTTGGSQTITLQGANSNVSLQGGSGDGRGSTNLPAQCLSGNVNIYCDGSATLKTSHNTAFISNAYGGQTIDFQFGGNLSLTGGANGVFNYAGIYNTSAGQQKITSSNGSANFPGITLTGGASGGDIATYGGVLAYDGAGVPILLRNNAFIQSPNATPGAPQTIDAGTITLIGAGSSTTYGGASIIAPYQSITSTGDILLTAGAGANASVAGYGMTPSQIGNSTAAADVQLTVGGSLILLGGSGSGSGALVGSRQFEATVLADVANDITVSAGSSISGPVSATIGSSEGHGGAVTLRAGRDIVFSNNTGITSKPSVTPTTPMDVTLLAQRDIALGQVATNSYGGAITLMAGWNGNTTTPALATVAPSGGYGGSLAMTGASIQNAGAVSAQAYAALSLDSITGATILGRSGSGSLTLNSLANLIASGSGDSLVLATGVNFVNNAGVGSLSASAGRWLVYSTAPALDTRGGLVYDFKQYALSYSGTSYAGPGSGNGFIYSVAPSLTSSLIGTTSKVYDGTTVASLTAANYAIAGALDSDTIVLSNPATGTYGDKNTGTGKIVSATVALTGASNGSASVYGYQLSSTTASGAIGSITVRPLSTWIGGASGNWSVASNWDALPDLANVLAVSVPTGKSVTYDAAAGNTSLVSLTAAGFGIAGGTLNIANSLTVDSSFSKTGGTLSFGAGASASITQASGNLSLPALTVASLSLNAPAGAITQSGAIVASNLVTQSVTGTTLTDAGNQIASFTATNSGSGNVALTNTGALSIGGISNSGGNITVDNTGAVTTVGAVSAPTGSVSIVAHSPLSIGSGGVSAGGDILLTAGGTTALTDNLTLNGAVATTGSASSVTLLANDNLVQNANVTTSGGAVTATAQTGSISMAPATTTSTSGGSISYTPTAGSATLSSLDAGTGSITLSAGGSITPTAGVSGANLTGGTATIVAGGDVTLSTQVSVLDVTASGTYSILDLLTGSLMTNVPVATSPATVAVLSTVTTTTQTQTTQTTTQTTTPPPPTTTTTSDPTMLLINSTQTTGGTVDTFGGSSGGTTSTTTTSTDTSASSTTSSGTSSSTATSSDTSSSSTTSTDSSSSSTTSSSQSDKPADDKSAAPKKDEVKPAPKKPGTCR
jgi:filamentous hemagglutinin family protein